MKRGFAIIAAIVVASISVPDALALTAQGQLSIATISSGTVNIPISVTLGTNLELWRISVVYTNRQDTCGSDGEKTCFIRKWSAKSLKDARIPGGIPQATIVNGVYPGVSDIEDRIVWLAFASSSFFLKQTNPLPCLWRGGNGADLPSDYGVKIKDIDFLDSLGRLPAKVEFTFSTNQMLSVTNFQFLSYQEQTPARFQQTMMENFKNEGRLMAEYNVLRVTNFNGATIPLEFEFGIIAPGAATPWRTYRGSITNITDQTANSFLPEVEEPLQTVDYRFSDKQSQIDNLRYKIDSRTWPNTNDAALQAAFNQEKLRLPASFVRKNTTYNPKAIFIARLVLLALLLSVPGIVIWALKRKQKT
jgi:hypothetical protein